MVNAYCFDANTLRLNIKVLNEKNAFHKTIVIFWSIKVM